MDQNNPPTFIVIIGITDQQVIMRMLSITKNEPNNIIFQKESEYGINPAVSQPYSICCLGVAIK